MNSCTKNKLLTYSYMLHCHRCWCCNVFTIRDTRRHLVPALPVSQCDNGICERCMTAVPSIRRQSFKHSGEDSQDTRSRNLWESKVTRCPTRKYVCAVSVCVKQICHFKHVEVLTLFAKEPKGLSSNCRWSRDRAVLHILRCCIVTSDTSPVHIPTE